MTILLFESRHPLKDLGRLSFLKCFKGADTLHQDGRGQVNTTLEQHSLPQAQGPPYRTAYFGLV